MTERFVTGGYKIYDTFRDEEYLLNSVDAQMIADKMNNLDTKARERGQALSKLHKENEQLKQQLKEVKAHNNWLVSVLQDTGVIIIKGDVE